MSMIGGPIGHLYRCLELLKSFCCGGYSYPIGAGYALASWEDIVLHRRKEIMRAETAVWPIDKISLS